MTNRERYFNNMDSYDLMLVMKENLTRIGVYCPIDVITGKKPKCRLGYYDETMTTAYRDCESCIQAWHNADTDRPTKKDTEPPIPNDSFLMKRFLETK